MKPGLPCTAAALLGLALLGSASRVAASPVDATAFAPLVTEMDARDGALPTEGLTKDQKRQRAALLKADRALASPSQDLKGDLSIARRMATALLAGFPGDVTFLDLLTTLDDDLGVEVSAVRAEVATTISLAKAGRLRDRAQGKLDAADALFDAGNAAATPALRARFQERCHSLLLKADSLALKAGTDAPGSGSSMTAVVDGAPWAANTDFGTGISGLGDVSG